MSSHDLYLVALVVSGVLVLAAVSVRLTSWAGLPTLLVYLGFGVQCEDAGLTQVLGFALLAVILAEGGFRGGLGVGSDRVDLRLEHADRHEDSVSGVDHVV